MAADLGCAALIYLTAAIALAGCHYATRRKQ